MENIISKKRKRSCHDHHVYDHDHDHHEEEEEEEEEEEKIEKFYTLIKSIREARDRLIKGPDCDRKLDPHKEEINKEVQVWKPSFQREDFMELGANHDQPVMIKSPLDQKVLGSNPQKEEEVIKEALELDLTLSL